MHWDRPSARVAELIRAGASLVREAPDEWLEEIDRAIIEREDLRVVLEDPELEAAVKRANRANLAHWADANVREPGAPVPLNLGPEPLAIARDLVRRGLDESALESYRVGQNVAWRFWMRIAFELTSDPDELRELLDVTAQSIAGFIDAQITGITRQMELEREELTRGTHAERREVVTLIIDGAPITERRASTRLGYELARPHTAAVVWSDEPEPDRNALEAAAQAIAGAAGSVRPFTVIAGASTLWVWVAASRRPEIGELERALGAVPEARIALGPQASGIDGFRRSHLDAIATQRLLARMESPLRLATYEAVQMVSLVTQDEQRASAFVREALGDLEGAPAELRETVLTYLHEGSNASRAAERLYAHRNSVLRRLAKADDLLPRPLAENRIQVAVALEVLRWR
jgi:DNA-binding PucR family transcriptional regulator